MTTYFLWRTPELKSEEGYSADIVRTYIPGDIYPHNVGTMSAQHLRKDICLTREMLCGHSADIVRTYISWDICPHNVRTISFFGFQLWEYIYSIFILYIIILIISKSDLMHYPVAELRGRQNLKQHNLYLVEITNSVCCWSQHSSHHQPKAYLVVRAISRTTRVDMYGYSTIKNSTVETKNFPYTTLALEV